VRRLHFEDSTQNAVSQCVRPLRGQGWLQSQQVVGNHTVLIPGRRLARTHGLPQSYGELLPRQPLLQNLGATLFLSLDVPRKRLLPRELLREFPWLPKHLVYGRPFYFDHDDDGMKRLAVIRVELSASAYRIVEKHQKDLYKWNERREFHRLLDEDQFMIVTVTATASAAAKVADQIRQCPAYPRARVMAWPHEYLHLILNGETQWPESR
jgi:hypothetical protein